MATSQRAAGVETDHAFIVPVAQAVKNACHGAVPSCVLIISANSGQNGARLDQKELGGCGSTVAADAVRGELARELGVELGTPNSSLCSTGNLSAGI